MARVEHYGHADGWQKVREMIAESLPICAMVFSHIDQVHFPVVQVGVRNRPDVADLPRVHQLEGPEGDVWSQWILFNGQRSPLWAMLEVEFQRPVICRFRLAFRSDRHRELLEATASSGLLGLSTGPLHIDQHGKLRGPAIVMQTANAEYLHAFLLAADLVPRARGAA